MNVADRPALREVTQRFLANDPSGIPGDCVRAAVASLLDKDRESVPHFIGGDFDSRVWWYALKGWAAEHGWTVTRRGLLPRQDSVPLPAFGIACGPSDRGVSHAVVAVDGKVAWDPHPSRAGILRCKEAIEFEPVGEPGIRDFTWGESLGLDLPEGIARVAVNDADGKWIGDMRLDIDGAVDLANMLARAIANMRQAACLRQEAVGAEADDA